MGINIVQVGGANPSLDLIDDLTAKTLASFKQHGTTSGDHGSNVTLMDDFLGKAIGATWGVQKGSDGGTVNFAFLAGTSGIVRATTGAGAGASYAANGVQLDHALNWKAGNGNLVFETKMKISAITTIAFYVGFTDQLSALECPVTLSGTTFTTNATDAVGFLFDTNATTDTIRCVGVANDVDATMQDTGLAPVAATFKTYRVEVSAAGVATFFIDGVQVGTAMTGAVTTTIALTPVIACFTEAAGSATIDVDYILCQQLR
jgi:hypothetical protein